MINQMKKYIKNLKTPIAILGMGKSGEAAKRLLLLSGFSEDEVVTFDSKMDSVDYKDPFQLFSIAKPGTLVVSPGFPLSTPWLKDAISGGVHITSEISLACAYLSTEKIIGVTGSVGKSTTVSLLQSGLDSFSSSNFVGGNLGTPFAEYASDLIEGKRGVADWIALELSSYQLENCDGLVLDYSAITFFTSNHLERYEDLQQYYDTKWNILSITKCKMLLNRNGGDLIKYSIHKEGGEKIRIISKDDSRLSALQLEKALLIGKHNQDNLALAASLAIESAWPISSIKGMKSFTGLPHRLENLGEKAGIRFINDSKATALDSVLIATTEVIDSLNIDTNLFLLLGGRNKNLPWEQLKSLNSPKVIKFVFFGECREEAQQKSQLLGPSFPSLGEALAFTFKNAQQGDTVLLSPGGTSLDEFKSFEERGNFFKNKIAAFFKS
jgi:UDP-N-acetylmuramoylalanine--D-glutamate ligase